MVAPFPEMRKAGEVNMKGKELEDIRVLVGPFRVSGAM